MIVISKLAAAGGRMSLLRSRHWSGIARDGLNSPFLAMTAVYLQAEAKYQGPRKLSVDRLHARGLDQIFNSTNFSLLDSPFLAVTAVHSQASFTLQVNTVGPRYEDLIRVATYDLFVKDDRIRWSKDWSHGGLLLPTTVGMIQKTKPTQPDYD